MRIRLTLLAAASVAVGGLLLLTRPAAFADDLKKVAAQPTSLLPPGIEKATKDDSKDIRHSLARVTDAALNKDNLQSLVSEFVDADRNRIGNFFKDNKDPQLAGRIDQFLKDWNAKYNQKFALPYQVAFENFQGFTIAQGEIANPALLSNWPVDNPKATTGGQGKDAKAEGRLDTQNRPGNRPGDRNLEKGRNVAVVYFPESHHAPELNVSMIHELPDHWRVDVPDNIDGQAIYKQLLNHLTRLDEMKDQCPADVNDAYRMVLHHVLMAIYNIDMPEMRRPNEPGVK